MKPTITLDGMDEVLAQLADLGDAADDAIEGAVSMAALRVDGEVKKAIQRGARTGRVYQKYQPRREHRASAPGEAPATDTGTLVSSIYMQRISRTEATVGTPLAYAEWLEYGTQHIEPRPAWEPAIESTRPKFVRDVERALERALRT